MHWRGEVRDISVGGVGLVLERRFEPGTVLAVVLGGDSSRAGRPLLVRIAHTRALRGRRWQLGCVFLSRLSSDQLESLLLPETPPPAPANGHPESSSATAPRFLVVQGVLFEGRFPGGGRVAFSVRRLHLPCGWPPAAGTTLLLRLSEREPVRIRVRVQSCAPRDGSWVVGYDFAEPPSPAALRLLGHPRPATARAGI
jgi:hypothetical protein